MLVTLDFLGVTFLKKYKETGEINVNIIYLMQHIQNIIAPYNKYKNT